MNCPHCKSYAFVKNGHAPSKKQRWKCNNCDRTFAEYTSKGFPPTSIPFEFISWALYQKENNSRNLTKRVNAFLLSFYGPKRTKVSRSTIYSWTKKYGGIHKQLVTPHDIAVFFKRLTYIVLRTRFEKVEIEEPIQLGKKELKWKEGVQKLIDKYGEEWVRELAHDDKELFEMTISLIITPQKHMVELPVSDILLKRKK